MAIIRSGDGSSDLYVDNKSHGARVGLYDPSTGNPMVSFVRGIGTDLDTSAGVDVHDVFAIGLPGAGGFQVGGTSAAPLRTDPTGTTVQPVSLSGGVAVNNFPATQTVTGTVGVNGTVALAANTSVNVGNLPATQQVAGSVSVTNPVTSLAVNNFPATQQVAGNVAVTGSVAVTNPVTSVAVNNTSPIPTTVLDGTEGAAEFISTVDVAGAAAVADGGVLWALRNAGSKTIYVRRFDLQQGFAGTAAATRTTYEVRRFTGTITGGTAVTPAKKVTASVASGASILQGTAALTVTGVTWDAGALHRVSSPNQLTAVTAQDVIFQGGALALAPGEGVAIRAAGATVLGSFLAGSMGWYEL